MMISCVFCNSGERIALIFSKLSCMLKVTCTGQGLITDANGLPTVPEH